MADPSAIPTTESIVTTWEYATAPLISHALQQILNQWGAEGWELVAVCLLYTSPSPRD